MKILIFGRGVISTQYAWALENAGNNVEFYVRPGRKAEYGETVALNIYDARKRIKGVPVNKNWNIIIREDLRADHEYDLIILSVQHYQFKNAVDVLAEKIGQATLLIFNNFWDEPQEMVSKLPSEQLVWGFPVAGGGFDQNGQLNGALLQTITIGTFGKEPTKRTIQVIDLFKASGFRVKESSDFRSWLFAHFAFNAAINLENIKFSGMAPLEIMKTSGYWQNVIKNGRELLPLLKARNVDFNEGPDLKIFNYSPYVISLIIKLALRFLPPVKQVLTGHSNPYELKTYCKDVTLTAEKLNIPLPRFQKHKKLWDV